MDDLRERFARRLAGHRRRRGLTQERLATAAGLSVDMISRMESAGTGARFPTIERLAAALEIDPGELFVGDLPLGQSASPELAQIVRTLSRLSDRDLRWIAGVLDAALKARG